MHMQDAASAKQAILADQRAQVSSLEKAVECQLEAVAQQKASGKQQTSSLLADNLQQQVRNCHADWFLSFGFRLVCTSAVLKRLSLL